MYYLAFYIGKGSTESSHIIIKHKIFIYFYKEIIFQSMYMHLSFIFLPADDLLNPHPNYCEGI